MEVAPWLYRVVRAGVRGDEPPAPPGGLRPELAGMGELLPVLGAVARGRGGWLPGRLAEPAIEASHLAAMYNVMLLGAIVRIAPLLERAGVRWAVVKGMDHLCRLYPGPEWRRMADADLLVHPADEERVAAALGAAGFVQMMPVTPWVQPAVAFTDGTTSLDLHRRMSRRGTDSVDIDWVLDRTQVRELPEVGVRLLAPAPACAAAALSAGKDGFFGDLVGPLRLVEIALLADVLPAGGHQELRARMAAGGAARLQARADEVVAWVRGDAPRPRWADPRLGAVGGRPRWPSYARRLGRTARLQDGGLRAARAVALHAGVALLQRATGGRLGMRR